MNQNENPGALKSSPDSQTIEKVLFHEKYKARYRRILRSTVYALIIVAAISVLVATLLLPVLQISGDSMEPTLTKDEIVVSVKKNTFRAGDIVAFYYNNKILVKRIIAQGGQMVDIDSAGDVYVDNELIDEPYLTEKSFGSPDIEFPYLVPENTYFLLGDHREVSVDSRSSTIGCISSEDIVGTIVFSVWPMNTFGTIH